MVKPTHRFTYVIPFGLYELLDKEKKEKSLTQMVNEMVQLGLTITQNRDKLNDPEFVNTIVQNLEADKIDSFFNNLEPNKLEAVYAFAKAEMEKRYGKARLDKFV